MERFVIQEIDPEEHRLRAEALCTLVRAAAPFAEVFEVGSTALAGVVGKGDLDVLARCEEERFPELVEALDAALTFNPEQLNNARYRGYYWLDGDVERGAVQATVRGCEYDSFTAFADALAESEALVAHYNALKREHDGGPMAAYREAKGAFIERVLAGPEVPSAVPWSFQYTKRTPTFTEATVPAGLLRDHSTKAGVWGRIVVESGALDYFIEDERYRLVPGVVGCVPPEVLHNVSPVGAVSFWVEFLRER